MANETILIIDDVPVNLKIASVLLERAGYKTVTATNGEEALQIIQTRRPDLVISDLQMPGLDGLEMARRVRQDHRLRNITLIALTGYSAKFDMQKALEAGFDGYLMKPLDGNTIQARLRNYLDRRRSA